MSVNKSVNIDIYKNEVMREIYFVFLLFLYYFVGKFECLKFSCCWFFLNIFVIFFFFNNYWDKVIFE